MPTVPFNALDSTGVPLRPGDPDSPPPADQSASSDLSPAFSEMPTDQLFTPATLTAGIFQEVSDEESEDEKMKDQIPSTDSTILLDQGKGFSTFPVQEILCSYHVLTESR